MITKEYESLESLIGTLYGTTSAYKDSQLAEDHLQDIEQQLSRIKHAVHPNAKVQSLLENDLDEVKCERDTKQRLFEQELASSEKMLLNFIDERSVGTFNQIQQEISGRLKNSGSILTFMEQQITSREQDNELLQNFNNNLENLLTKQDEGLVTIETEVREFRNEIDKEQQKIDPELENALSLLDQELERQKLLEERIDRIEALLSSSVDNSSAQPSNLVIQQYMELARMVDEAESATKTRIAEFDQHITNLKLFHEQAKAQVEEYESSLNHVKTIANMTETPSSILEEQLKTALSSFAKPIIEQLIQDYHSGVLGDLSRITFPSEAPIGEPAPIENAGPQEPALAGQKRPNEGEADPNQSQSKHSRVS
ncbi:uncharacterized protein BJ171DRAFT_514735 [Polychytrium aggregatum]|uniref:uncharacterized protein n=1 Tax=Polychytrium aggregatum TaxID=110093 RepID=UPI0022FE66CB|nr:uncharacterized protein BJ171DRAFT_514735 [Polychytrium aggregatum]KAI9202337.1 hypothetical protein BJ171DRAFT_514735 [Polychytrium aggregatum]